MNFPIISISEVLTATQIAAMDGSASTFSVKFTKDDGSISEIKRASRNVKQGKATKGSHTNLRESHLMLVFDHDADTHKYITISLITYFNGMRVFH